VIRPAQPADVSAILAMVHELAEYERDPDAVQMTEPMLHEALFDPDPRVFAHVAVDDGGAVVGHAVWFVNFSSWTGRHGIWLDDLYVRPDHRGRGFGFGLLQALAAICVERGYGRLEWCVLDWNEPAIRFYRSIGAVSMDEWTTNRMTGDALARLATAEPATSA
jgi:GNAT superfamily N-acetyltransferase